MVGCSGCSYKHWHVSPARPQNFYPFKSTVQEYTHYASHFNALEINYTFYRLPPLDAVRRWAAEAAGRPGFTYTLKVHRYFTHTKRAHVDKWWVKKWTEEYWPRCALLGPHLGCVLFQFPYAFKYTPDITLPRIEALGQYLHRHHPTVRFALEFRDVSWFQPEVYAVLRQYNLGLCGIHLHNPTALSDPKGTSWGSLPSGRHPPLDAFPHDVCRWGAYLRFHGTGVGAHGSYGTEALKAWAQAAWAWQRAGWGGGVGKDDKKGKRTVYMFFNNDASMDTERVGLPSAVADATRMRELLWGLASKEGEEG